VYPLVPAGAATVKRSAMTHGYGSQLPAACRSRMAPVSI
jgi:hypothetical protein